MNSIQVVSSNNETFREQRETWVQKYETQIQKYKIFNWHMDDLNQDQEFKSILNQIVSDHLEEALQKIPEFGYPYYQHFNNKKLNDYKQFVHSKNPFHSFMMALIMNKYH